MLEAELNFYRKNKAKLKKLYQGKYVVIKHSDILGTYETHAEAYNETVKEHEVGTFIIKHITADNS